MGEVERLRLLASAIAGRALEVAVAGDGEPAWTDGATVFVAAGAPPAEQLRQVAVQASLLAAGSLDPGVVGALARRPALARRYLAVEGHRALAANPAVPPPVLHDLATAPPAPPAPLDRGRGSRSGSGSGDGAVRPLDAAASLAVARSRAAIAEPPATFGTIRPRRLLAGHAAAASGPPDGAAAVSSNDRSRPSPPPGRGDDLDELDVDDPDDERQVGDLLSSPVGGRGPIGRLLQRLLTATRRPGGGGPAGADAPTHAGRARPGSRGRVLAIGRLPDTADEPTVFGPRARTYPEWDVHRRRYRPDWCTVHERDVRPEDLAPLALPDGRALRRPLARLGTGRTRVRRRPQGDDVDLDAVVDAQVATRAGGTPAGDDLYVESLRRRRDLSVLVLLDMSGSAGEPGPGGRTVHEHQRAAAGALVTALHDLGDRVALHAFHSQGRKAVHLTRVKGFDERLDGRVARRLGGLTPGAYTRLGAAIRHGSTLLEEGGGTSRRLLVVLSDGFAYDHGYGGRYGEADARRALTEARRRGLGCVCVSIGAPTPPAALRRVFGSAAHAAVPTADRLPGLVAPLFRAALRSSEAQRRRYQRKQRERRSS